MFTILSATGPTAVEFHAKRTSPYIGYLCVWVYTKLNVEVVTIEFHPPERTIRNYTYEEPVCTILVNMSDNRICYRSEVRNSKTGPSCLFSYRIDNGQIRPVEFA